jgi:hypothetical protein
MKKITELGCPGVGPSRSHRAVTSRKIWFPLDEATAVSPRLAFLAWLPKTCGTAQESDWTRNLWQRFNSRPPGGRNQTRLRAT